VEPRPLESKGVFASTAQLVQESIIWRKGADADATDPLISPLLASDDMLRQFAPVHLLADKEMFHQRRRVGVPAELEVFENTHHIFQVNPVVFRDKARDSMERLKRLVLASLQPDTLDPSVAAAAASPPQES